MAALEPSLTRLWFVAAAALCLVLPVTPVRAAPLTWRGLAADVRVTNEVTKATGGVKLRIAPGTRRYSLASVGLDLTETLAVHRSCATWDLELRGAGRPVGHELLLELPLLDRGRQMFTPTERGTMSIAWYPSFELTPYGANGWRAAPCRFNVLPMVAVLDGRQRRGLAVALPPDAPIPDLRIDWRDARVLRLRMGRRGVGAGRMARFRLIFMEHAPDWRCAIKAYADRFPSWFEPGLPRGPHEGAFYYHHIQDRPASDEMRRQGVRFLWASFWFPYLGEYLPAEPEWYPYTYAKWWKLGQTMTDDRIREFVRSLAADGIGTFAYFNVTEYGGFGGRSGSAEEAAKLLQERYADALMKDERDQAIPTWEGAMAMNPRSGASLAPVLREQVQRHLARLPEIAGFCIDRLDWAGLVDYGHDDGSTMVGDRTVEHLAGPVSTAVAEVCRQAHAAGKRVYVNQFWRVEPLRDADGVCHEADYVRGLGYVSPYRPIAAWHQQRPYAGDLLAFEAQLKLRLLSAVQPQMIAASFPISQQGPSPAAAAMLERYAPLFEALRGKRQVLSADCVRVSGANDAGLFVNAAGEFVAPVTSRVRFASRGVGCVDTVTLRIRARGATAVSWAKAISLDGRPMLVPTSRLRDGVAITLPAHRIATMVVAGSGSIPAGLVRASPSPSPASRAALAGRPPAHGARLTVVVRGTHVGTAVGRTDVWFAGRRLGDLRDGVNRFQVLGQSDDWRRGCVRLAIRTGDEGTWFAVERVEVLDTAAAVRLARWTCDSGLAASDRFGSTELSVPLIESESMRRSRADWVGADRSIQGAWQTTYGRAAAWMPHDERVAAAGTSMRIGDGATCVWAQSTDDARALVHGAARTASCWFADPDLTAHVDARDDKPYRLTLYVLDYDRNGRSCEVAIEDDAEVLDKRPVSTADSASGVYLTWLVRGPVTVRMTKRTGYNTVLSGVFIDPS